MTDIPADVLVNIFCYLPSAFDILKCSYVCTAWYSCVLFSAEQQETVFTKRGVVRNASWGATNDMWKALTFITWPQFSPYNNIRNWLKLYKRRAAPKKLYAYDLIEACPEMEFECPIVWESFQYIDEDEMFCQQCRKPVYNVYTLEEIDQHASVGNCVAFRAANRRHIVKGKPKCRLA
jgi:hypothetical protein